MAARSVEGVNRNPDDVVTGSLDRDAVLDGAPDSENGFFKVPRILDES